MPATGSTAQAAVLARLWGALAREPIAGVGHNSRRDQDVLVIPLADGRELRGAAAMAEPFTPAAADFSVVLDETGVTPDQTSYVDPADLLVAMRLAGRVDGLIAEVRNSVANLELAHSRQPSPDGGEPVLTRAQRHADPLAYLEGCVVDGHPLHPCCRTRMGLSAAEVLAYAPEHRPVVELIEYAVPPERWLAVNCPPRLWVHPWQRDHVLDRYPLLRPTGQRAPARPLMSLRTLAHVADPTHHVKTAVDVQMTSAVRTVSGAAIRNGPAISALLESLGERVAPLRVMPEFATGVVLIDGEPCRSLGVVHRRHPALGAQDVSLPVAALMAPSPVDGRPIVVEVVDDGYDKNPLSFVDALARLMLPPLLSLLDLGIALEAHGQNLLLVLRQARAVGLLYRDMGGVRVSPALLSRHGIDVAPLHGDVISDEPAVLRTKLLAAAISTVLGEVIATLGREYAMPTDAAWRLVAAAGAHHDSLTDATLPVKATTAMRLAADPLEDLWASLPNPMAGLR